MKIFEQYQNLLIEAEVQSCVKHFGYELFGDELGGKERNTGIENAYVDDIQDFTDNRYGEETKPEFMAAIKKLQSCIKQYPEVLIPESTKVYRGLKIPIKYFIINKIPVPTDKAFDYVYKASSPVQSWSLNANIAATFGNHDSLNDLAKKVKPEDFSTPESRQELLALVQSEGVRIPFVLRYETNPSEFLFKAKYFNLISKASHEDETIRVDNRPVQVKAKFNDSLDVFQTYAGTKLLRVINQAITEY